MPEYLEPAEKLSDAGATPFLAHRYVSVSG